MRSFQMPRATLTRSTLQAVMHAAAAASIGLVGLPFVFARTDTDATRAWMWLVLATATGVWLVAVAPVFAGRLRQSLARLSGASGRARIQTEAAIEISRLAPAAACVLLIQAIVRRPLVAVIGVEAEPFIVEATLAAVALLVLLMLLGLMHHAGRPLI